MASESFTADLTCSVCLTLFTDPVVLLCGHSFCRTCVSGIFNLQRRCPLCQTAMEAEHPRTSYSLRSLADKANEAARLKREDGGQRVEEPEFCPEHDEKLKLFCVTEQQLICVICRDGQKHEGHQFKPIKEAAASLRQQLEKGMENLSADINAIEHHANAQRAEMKHSKEKSAHLMSQIHSQFHEMHQFLTKREDEIKSELRHKEEDEAEKMSKSLSSIEAALSESQELEAKVASVLDISDSEMFLKSCIEGKTASAQQVLFRPRANEFQVASSSLCLGPYESHLQVFIWKEMLQVIQPREELLLLRAESTDVIVSNNGQSLIDSPKINPNQAQSSFGSISSQASTFASEQGFGISSTFFSVPAKSSLGTGQPITPKMSTPFGSKAGFGQPITPKMSTPFGSKAGFGQPITPKMSTPFGSKAGFGQPITPKMSTAGFGCQTYCGCASSVIEFSTGKHYWEIEVGEREYWELGVQGHFLRYDGQTYTTCPVRVPKLPLEGALRKLGIYLDCSSQKVSFYDAANMRCVHTMTCSTLPVSAYFKVTFKLASSNPLVVCWY